MKYTIILLCGIILGGTTNSIRSFIVETQLRNEIRLLHRDRITLTIQRDSPLANTIREINQLKEKQNKCGQVLASLGLTNKNIGGGD